MPDRSFADMRLLYQVPEKSGPKRLVVNAFSTSSPAHGAYPTASPFLQGRASVPGNRRHPLNLRHRPAGPSSNTRNWWTPVPVTASVHPRTRLPPRPHPSGLPSTCGRCLRRTSVPQGTGWVWVRPVNQPALSSMSRWGRVRRPDIRPASTTIPRRACTCRVLLHLRSPSASIRVIRGQLQKPGQASCPRSQPPSLPPCERL